MNEPPRPEQEERPEFTLPDVDSPRDVAARRRVAILSAIGVVVLLGLIAFAVLATRARQDAAPQQVIVTDVPAPEPVSPGTVSPGPTQNPTPQPPATPHTQHPTPNTQRPTPPPGGPKPAARPAPKPVEAPLARLKDPGGATVLFLREGTVRVSGMTLPPELGRSLYRLYVLERAPAVEQGAPASAEPPIRLTAPDPGDSGVESTTPVFRWTEVPGVAGYTLVLERLANVQTGEWAPVETAAGESLTKPEWAVPAESPLARGTRYRWHVEAARDGETLRSPTVDFRVLTDDELRQLSTARERYGNVPFLLGPHYESLGLHEEATWEYLKLARANPTSPQAQRALENVKLKAERHRMGMAGGGG